MVKQAIDKLPPRARNVRPRLGLILLVLGVAVLVSLVGVSAAGECEYRDSLVQRLMLKFAEQPSSYGQADPRTIVELFEAEHGKTWSLVVTTSDGVSCLVAAGEEWQRVAWQPGGRRL